MFIHNVDLHFHAGQERQPDVTLGQYFDYAQKTGRKILGVTDHYGLYFPQREITRRCMYKNSLDGLIEYREDVEALKSSFPDITILFAPEIGPRDDLKSMPSQVIDMSDYFIAEPLHTEGSIDDNTNSFISRLYEISDFMQATGKPIYTAHPFRSAINHRLIKRKIEPWVTRIVYRDHWGDFSYEEIRDFFMLDIKRVAKASRKLDIPIEINGNTQYRTRSSNLPAALQILWAALGVILDEGVDLVPGSDLHGFVAGVGNIGQYVPVDCFEALGIEYDDIRFMKKIL
ncbi:MAG: hypothetical protein GX974_07550 [Clostridiales bacterium]|nr:hypothetical protein [Clostridiales bacterium]